MQLTRFWRWLSQPCWFEIEVEIALSYPPNPVLPLFPPSLYSIFAVSYWVARLCWTLYSSGISPVARQVVADGRLLAVFLVVVGSGVCDELDVDKVRDISCFPQLE